MFNFRKKAQTDQKETPFYAEGMEICFHPVYTQTPVIYLMTKSEETRVQFLYFVLGSMDVYFDRFDDPDSIQTRHENVALFAAYLEDREGVLADPEKEKELSEHVDALFKKVMLAADDLSLDDKLNMVLYNAKGFLGLEWRSRKNGKMEKLKEAWAVCEEDAKVFLLAGSEAGETSEESAE